jgi:hypothetical protein
MAGEQGWPGSRQPSRFPAMSVTVVIISFMGSIV